MKILKLTLMSLATLGLTGCLSSVLPEPAPAASIYRLVPQDGPQVAAENATIVRIDRPTAPRVLSGNDVVVSPDGRRLATASLATWAEPIPVLVQRSFFDVLSSRSSLVGVLPTSGARTDIRTHLTIRHFEAQFDQGEGNAPLAIVQYAVTVSDAGTRNLMGTYDVRKTQRAGSASVSAIVQAQDMANAQAMSDIADWLESLTGVDAIN